MAFESLTDKLQRVFKNLRGKGRLTEEDVKTALKEVKMALLEADVNFKVVKQFIKSVEERAVGQDVMNGLNPGQMVIKIVNEEMIALMGSETTEIAMQPGKAITVIMMAGLQGAGKTTATAKLAGKLKTKGKKSLLVACDITDLRQSNSCRSTERSRKWMSFPWERITSRWRSPERRLLMRRRTDTMLSFWIQPDVFMWMRT